MINEVGRINKSNITLIEYDSDYVLDGRYFVQVGIAGLYCTKKELIDLYTILNYYINIDNFTDCNIKVGEQDVAIR